MALTCPEARAHGPWNPCLARYSHDAEVLFRWCSSKVQATWNEVGLLLMKEWRFVTLS